MGVEQRSRRCAGSAGLVLADGVPLLHPEPQLREAILAGCRNQILARNLAAATIAARARQVRRFHEHLNAFPWEWSPALTDEWFADLRSIRGCTRSTVRGYQVAVRAFCAFVIDPAYGWAGEFEQRFGTHPVRVITELDAAADVADVEAEPMKRSFTRPELQALFDYADEQGARKRTLGARAGCQRSAIRRSSRSPTATGCGTPRPGGWTPAVPERYERCCCKPHHPWSPACSATAARKPRPSPPNPAPPGSTTPLAVAAEYDTPAPDPTEGDGAHVAGDTD